MNHNEATALYAASDLYQLLSLFMFRTERTTSNAIRSGTIAADTMNILEELGYTPESIAHLVEGLQPLIACGARDEETYFHALRKDFTHLFSNPSFSVVRIHESEYLNAIEDRSARNLNINDIARDALTRYERVGMQSLAQASDQPDHMGLELRYMQTLRNAQAFSLESGNAETTETIGREAADFLEQHIAPWALILR